MGRQGRRDQPESGSGLVRRASLLQVGGDELELFEGGAEVFDDLGGDDAGIGEVCTVLQRRPDDARGVPVRGCPV